MAGELQIRLNRWGSPLGEVWRGSPFLQQLQRPLNDGVLRIHYLVVFVHFPEVAGDERLQLQAQIGQRAAQFFIVLGLHLLLLALSNNLVYQTLGNLKLTVEGLKVRIVLLQQLEVVVNVAQVGCDDDALG